ncbi:VIT domain-containing protein [Pendulispora albinea]|uniref:Vault protein inter-alpha-trypsin n=1 Tax=Pendulispora albinea TaxID=2741071 RepID=A0ABZ2M270_9BACT
MSDPSAPPEVPFPSLPASPPPPPDVPPAWAPPSPASPAPHASPAPPETPYRSAPEPPAAPRPSVSLHALLAGAFAVLAVLAMLAVLIFRVGAPKKAQRLGARLDLAAGDVSVVHAGGEGKAISGTPLAADATVKTAKGARALVRTGEGAAIFLRGETTLKLLERGASVDSGEIWLDAPRVEGDALEVKVGAISISATDAGVSIKRDAKDVTVYVARGLAVVTSPGGRVEINAGEQGIVRGEGKADVAPMAFWQDWTGGMGDQRASRFIASGTGRVYGVDHMAPPGAAARKLGIAKQVVRAVIRDGIAETEVDQTFSNPSGTPIEGWYWFTIPTTATVSGFALENDGQLVEGEVIERSEAAARYEAALVRKVDPALLEWVDGRTYRARIYPIPASGTRRIVLRYVEMLPSIEGKTRYVYPLRSDDPVRFDEFALSVDIGRAASEVEVASSLDARVEEGGSVIGMRRSGYTPRADFQLELTNKTKRSPVSAWRFSAESDQADYVMLRYVPGQDFTKEPPANVDAVFVVDTSAGGDDTARQLRIAAAEAALRALSEHDHFALVALDVTPSVVYPKDGLAPATEGDITKALEKLSDHAIGGATDLGAMFEPALARLHGKEQAALVYVGDGTPTSGETGAEALLERLRRSLTGSRARFFAIGTGPETQHELLVQLARAGGGQYVRIDEPGQTTDHALRLASAIKTATITDVTLDLGAGLDQPLYSATGKLARGEELVLLARTHHPLPDTVTVHGRVSGKDFAETYPLRVDTGSVTASLVPRLWASEYARRLIGSASAQDDNRAQVLQIGIEYGLVTPYTSSLALESESAYAHQGIVRRRSRVRGVRLSALGTSDVGARGELGEEEMLRGAGILATRSMMGCNNNLEPPAARQSSTETALRAAPPSGGNSTGAVANEAVVEQAPGVALAAQAPAPSASGALNDKASNERGPADLSDALQKARGGAEGSGPAAGAHTRPMRGSPMPPESIAAGATDPRNARRNSSAPSFAGFAAPKAAPPQHKFARTLGRCSDVAARPLAERMVVWQKRAKKAGRAEALPYLFNQAIAACELPDWRDEAALLDILQQRIDTEQGAEILLAHFAGYPDDQRFLAKNILRRTVDVRIAAAVSRALYGGIDWPKVDRELMDLGSTDKQIARLKAAMLVAPGDPAGDVRLVKLLARSGQQREALAHGRHLRDRGFLTPTLAQQLGDVLAESGERDEALRTYSEIVEFDGQNPLSRRVLGDIFLRQGWYPAAYRQYKTLADLDPKNPLTWLRLANAAAGSGRIDEALRIEREVQSGEGTPGPNDPRMFARLLSAARLGSLLDKPDPAAGVTPEAVSRKLKELSLFNAGPGTLTLVTWEDLDAQLVLGAADEKKETLAGEATDAGAVGLFAVLGAPGSWERAPHAIRYKSEILARKVPFRLIVLTWDGTSFRVTTKTAALEANAKQAAL